MTKYTTPTSGAVPVEFLRGVIALCTQRGYSPENIEAWSTDDKWIADLWRQAAQMLAAAPAQPAAQQGAAYAATPTSNYAGRVYEEGFLIGTCPLYTADQLRAFADATYALRAAHGQAPAETGNSVSAQADSVPAIQGETNVQLDTDPNPTAPGQQRDMACSLALGQPVGNGSDQVAGHPSAQGDKLLTVAERNIRSFLRSATFKSESDREAALNCVDVLWEAARASEDSVQEDAARYRLLRRGQHWSVIDGIGNELRAEALDAATDSARAAQKEEEKP